jgi:hypothetical protein
VNWRAKYAPKTITITFLLTWIFSFGQTFKEDPTYLKQAPNAKGYMLDTVVVSNFDKKQLYSNALSYLSNTYKDSRFVIESQDLELGEIAFTGSAKAVSIHRDTTKKGKITTYQWPIVLNYKCKVYVKDQKYKIVMNNLELQKAPGLCSTSVDVKLNDPDEKPASHLAVDILKDVATYMNRKPENDF